MDTLANRVDPDRIVGPMDMKAATRRAWQEADRAERDHDQLTEELGVALRAWALGVGDEDLIAETEAEIENARRRHRRWTMAAKRLEDELGISRNINGEIERF